MNQKIKAILEKILADIETAEAGVRHVLIEDYQKFIQASACIRETPEVPGPIASAPSTPTFPDGAPAPEVTPSPEPTPANESLS